jgi:2-polyprenyl-3-methyl-5-hydroxy-6-metoxy-1,4-benzoquinol methylase
LIEKYTKIKGKLLDIGCNIGSLIEVSEKRGWQSAGIDVNKSAINVAKKRGLNCFVGDFFKLNGKFDLITMNDVIEHLEDPNEALKKANSLLNKRKYIYISTPKGNSLMSKLAKGKWQHRKPKQHLYIFTSRILTQMLENNGFEVLHISTFGRIRSIRVIIKKIGSYSPLIKMFLNKFVPEFIKSFSISINPRDEMHIIARKKSYF